MVFDIRILHIKDFYDVCPCDFSTLANNSKMTFDA